MFFLYLLIFLNVGFSGELSEKEEVRKTLKFSDQAAASYSLLVDNMNGSIDVVGYDGKDVQLVVHEVFRGISHEKIAEARKRVTLDLKEENDRIVIYVDAPWRCSDGSIRDRGESYYGYDADFDFELSVPFKTNLELKTVNNGDVNVRNVEGDYDVDNVNGSITMEGIAGSGKAGTVNGSINVQFRKNPLERCSFSTVNGEVEGKFQDDLSADVRLKTFNGQVYTDFTFGDLPTGGSERERHGRRSVYRKEDSFAVRIGTGGPELTFDTLNGNIYILKRTN